MISNAAVHSLHTETYDQLLVVCGKSTFPVEALLEWEAMAGCTAHVPFIQTKLRIAQLKLRGLSSLREPTPAASRVQARIAMAMR